MAREPGLKVTVQGDVDEKVLRQISEAVQETVRREVAKFDLLKDYREEARPNITGNNGKTGGIWLLPPEAS